MQDKKCIKMILSFAGPLTDLEELERMTQNVMSQLRDIDDLDVQRVVDLEPPQNGKGVGSFLPGAVSTKGTTETTLKVIRFLRSRLFGRCIELEIEDNGRYLKVKASNTAELEVAIKQAKSFLS